MADGGLPKLVTCSWTAYRRDMGTAVKISRGAPRWISLPNPRYTSREHWPYIEILAPKNTYLNAPADVFMRRYFDQLEANAPKIIEDLLSIPPEHGALALLCFEKDVSDPTSCHRRMLAAWWERKTGQAVAELGGGK